MTEKTNDFPQGPIAAAPIIKQPRSVSIVWFIPLVALLIGGWLVYKAVTEKGPIITINFATADGLEAGKTKVKFKDVEVGVVEEVGIVKDLSGVLIRVQMKKGSDPYLTENTNFWVVRARVGADKISGLGTLLGGAYIGMEPASKGKELRHFQGLADPPVVTGEMEGKHFSLSAARLGSLNPGSPIYFRQIKVGQVVNYKLDDNGKNVGVNIFIESPYHQFVRKNTRFWIASGIDLQLTADGLRINTESVVSLMIGGIAFAAFPSENLEPEAEEHAHFTLYETRDAAQDDQYTAKNEYFIEFNESVRGLSEGAPVEFRGLRIGSVSGIELKQDFENLNFSTMVKISFERQRLALPADIENDINKRLNRMIKRGLRAQLKTGNLVTGQLFVDIDYLANVPPATISSFKNLNVIPSVPSTSQRLMQDIAQFVKKLDQLPMKEIGENLQSSLKGIDQLVNNPELQNMFRSLQRILTEVEVTTQTLNTETVPEVNNALKDMQNLLNNMRGWTSTDSTLYHDLGETLNNISEAARAVSDLANLLERHPEALIQGKESEGQL